MLKAFTFLILSVHILSCASTEENETTTSQSREVQSTKKDSLPPKDIIPPEVPDDLYTVLIDSTAISLSQWDCTIQFNQLGTPLKEKTRQLDKNSDTHAGSFIKDLEYEGLKLKLFSPSQNGKRFWVQEIIFTSSKIQTSRKIRLGDSFEKVKRAYPEMKIFPGDTENMFYVADAGYEKSIEMEFENEKLVKFRMYYMIP